MPAENLHLVQLTLDSQRLARSIRQRDRSVDQGYLLHMALEGLFGAAVLRPFSVAHSRRGSLHDRRLRVLAYSLRTAEELALDAETFASPGLHSAVRWDDLASKPLPTVFPPSRRLGFSLRAIPTRRSREGDGRVVERDAFLTACLKAPDSAVDRNEVYLGWLSERLEGRGARLVQGRVAEFHLARLYRRTQGSDRRGRRLQRPDVRFEGCLEVVDSVRFLGLLRQGVGRHKAFGYGMLLLSRPTC